MNYIVKYILDKIDKYGETSCSESSKPYRLFFDIRNIITKCNNDAWILVSDRTPEEYHTKIFDAMNWGTVSDDVLVTFVDEDVVNGTKEPYDGDRFVGKAFFRNGKIDKSSVLGRKIVPVAWMPMITPYEGDFNNGTTNK